MTASMNADSDLELFREDLEAVKRDVASLIEHMKGVATNSVQNVACQVEQRVRSLRLQAGAEGERSESFACVTVLQLSLFSAPWRLCAADLGLSGLTPRRPSTPQARCAPSRPFFVRLGSPRSHSSGALENRVCGRRFSTLERTRCWREGQAFSSISRSP